MTTLTPEQTTTLAKRWVGFMSELPSEFPNVTAIQEAVVIAKLKDIICPEWIEIRRTPMRDSDAAYYVFDAPSAPLEALRTFRKEFWATCRELSHLCVGIKPDGHLAELADTNDVTEDHTCTIRDDLMATLGGCELPAL